MYVIKRKCYFNKHIQFENILRSIQSLTVKGSNDSGYLEGSSAELACKFPQYL